MIKAYLHTSDLPIEAKSALAKAADYCAEFGVEWFENLQNTVFANDGNIRYLTADSDSRLQAILPIRVINRNGIRSIESLSNYYTSLYSPTLTESAEPETLEQLLEHATKELGPADVMRFSPMDPDASAYKVLLAAIQRIGWKPFPYYCFGNWYQAIADNWQNYFNQREGQLRSTIKRKGKKFFAEGGTLEIITKPDDVEAGIAAYTNVYSRSWKKPEPYPNFIPGLIRWLAAKGQLRLGIARFKQQPIASQIWIVTEGKACIFKLAYDEAHAKLAAGTLLTAYLMEHVIDRDGVREVDYLIGDDDYKKTWMSHRRERWGIIAYNPRTPKGLFLFTKEKMGRLMRRLVPRK